MRQLRKRKNTVRKKVLCGIILYLLLIIGLYMVQYTESINKVIGITTVILSVVWVYQCWNNLYLLILSLFVSYSNYSIVMGIYLDTSLRPEFLYPQIQDVQVYGIGIAMMFLVMFNLVVLTPKYNNVNNLDISLLFIRKENDNKLLFFIAMALFILFMILGYQVSFGTRGVSSPLYEYDTIFLIIMFYFSGARKINRFLCAICCCFYVLTSLLNGTRVEALACMIILFLCLARKGIKHWVVLVGMIAGLFVFSGIGAIRGNWAILSKGASGIFTALFKNKMVFDTCTHAYFPMLCMIEQFKEFSFGSAVHYLFAFLATIFMGQSRVKDGDLIQVMANKYYHNYGGVTAGFFWVWFSYIGSIVYALIIYVYEKFIANSSGNPSDYSMCMILYVVAFVPRWYLYGPWALLRGVLICIIVFSFFSMANKIFRLKRGKML